MALTIGWGSDQVIHVPKADLNLLSGTLYELDTNLFRMWLKDLEDGEGMPFPDTHRHNTEVTVAGITYARTIEIINGYRVEFEDGQYSVILTGSNNNIWDVSNGVLVQNQVQVIPTNSAGLITVATGGGSAPSAAQVADAVWNRPAANHTVLSSMGGMLRMLGMLGRNKTVTDPVAGTMTVYDDDGVTPLFTAPLYEDVAGTQPYRGQGADRRERLT